MQKELIKRSYWFWKWCSKEGRYQVTLLPCSHGQPISETMTSRAGKPENGVTWRDGFQERLALLEHQFPPVIW